MTRSGSDRDIGALRRLGRKGGAWARHRNWSGGDSPSNDTVTIWRMDGSPQRSHGGGSNLTDTRRGVPEPLSDSCEAVTP